MVEEQGTWVETTRINQLLLDDGVSLEEVMRYLVNLGITSILDELERQMAAGFSGTISTFTEVELVHGNYLAFDIRLVPQQLVAEDELVQANKKRREAMLKRDGSTGGTQGLHGQL